MSSAFCPHEDCTAKGNAVFDDCVNSPGAKPDEGSVGICYDCGGWWEIKEGKRVKYTPTKEELELAMTQIEESRRRFKEFKKIKGWVK